MDEMVFDIKQKKEPRSFLVILILCISSFLFLYNLPLWIFEQTYWWSTNNPPEFVLKFMSLFGLFRFFLAATVFTNLYAYILICAITLFLILFVIVRYRLPIRQRVLFSLVLLSILIFIARPYQPAIQMMPEYNMKVLTGPNLLLRGLRNSMAIGGNKPCTYELLGWKNHTLFYSANCAGGETQTWRYDAESSFKPVRYIESLPDGLQKQQVSPDKVSKFVSTKDIYPREVEPTVRMLYLPSSGMTSSSEKFIALIPQHLYSIEDVIVFEYSNADRFYDQH